MSGNAKILISTLALKTMADIKEIISDECGFEIFIDGHEWENREKALGLLQNIIDKRQVPLTMHGPMYGVDLSADVDSNLYTKTINSFVEAINLCARLGCRHLVVHTHNGIVPGGAKIRKQQNFIAAIQKLASFSLKKNVHLLVENIGTKTNNTILFNVDEYIALFNNLDKSLKIGSILDIGHAHLNQWNIPDVMERLDGYLYAMHVHDNHGIIDEHLPLGLGKINFDAIFIKWDSLTGKPDIVLEYDPTEHVTIEKIKEDVQYVKSHII